MLFDGSRAVEELGLAGRHLVDVEHVAVDVAVGEEVERAAGLLEEGPEDDVEGHQNHEHDDPVALDVVALESRAQQVEADEDQQPPQEPRHESEREAVVALAQDVPTLWHAETTTPQERQQVARLLLEEVRVAITNQGVLDTYAVSTAETGLARGNIYRGVVANIQPSLNAAFIDSNGSAWVMGDNNTVLKATGTLSTFFAQVTTLRPLSTA